MSVAAPPPAPPVKPSPAPALPPAPAGHRFRAYTALRPFSVAEYQRMTEIGILTDEDKVELLDGLVVLKMPRNPSHDASVQALTRLLPKILPAEWDVRIQSAVALATSVPEPDAAIVRGSWRDYLTRHPAPADVGFVVEVADSSLDRDRHDKGPIYASAGLTVYWIVNLVDQLVEVYTNPTGTGPTAGYADRQEYHPGHTVPVTLDGTIIAQVAVSELIA